MIDSIWDRKLEEANRRERPIEVELDDGSRYFGWYEVAREDTGAEPWIHLERVERQASVDGQPSRMEGVTGVLIHRDKVRRVTIYESEAETKRRLTADG